MKEIWKDIKGYEGLYEVSNLGRVKSLDYHRTRKEKILSPGLHNSGYLKVTLCKNRKEKQYLVHRLVATTFIENPDNLPIINHKDQNKHNNRVSNLEFCTYRYNNIYSKARKVACYKDGKLIKIYDVMQDAEKDGFQKSKICLCCQGKFTQHHGYQWKYIE